jgi:hypothetical protein
MNFANSLLRFIVALSLRTATTAAGHNKQRPAANSAGQLVKKSKSEVWNYSTYKVAISFLCALVDRSDSDHDVRIIFKELPVIG